MTILDDRILEHLDEDGWSSPSIMSSLTEFRYATCSRISNRCKMLSQAGLAAPIAGDSYEITRWGQLYLAGELDAEHQPVPSKTATLAPNKGNS